MKEVFLIEYKNFSRVIKTQIREAEDHHDYDLQNCLMHLYLELMKTMAAICKQSY